MRHNLMLFHRSSHGFGDLRKVNPPLNKRFHGNLIRRIQYRGKCSALLARAPRQAQRRKPFHIRLLKGQTAQPRQNICLNPLAARPRSGYVSAY